MTKGDSGKFSAKDMSELKTTLASVLTKLDKLDKLETSYSELWESFKETIASFDKAIGSSKIDSPQIDNQESVPEQNQNSNVEIVDPLDDGVIDSASENQIVELPNQEKTDVILRRQVEQAERKIM
jgi:uncharacterized protein YccT (UPF0319 family)